MPLTPISKDGILTLHIGDDRLVDPDQITRLFNDIQGYLGKSDEDRIILDFAAVKFMASSALGKLVQVHKKCGEFRAKLKLAGVSKDIMEVFKITKLNKVLDIAADEATARKAFQKTGLFR